MIHEEESNEDEVGDLKLKIFAAEQDATAMQQQCKVEQQNEKSAINVLDSILTDKVNQYFTIEAGAREVFESQPIVPPVMQEYMYEDPMWPPTPPRALTSYLGVHHAHAPKSSQVELTYHIFPHLAKLEGIHNQDPFVVFYDTYYGRKPLFDELFSKLPAKRH